MSVIVGETNHLSHFLSMKKKILGPVVYFAKDYHDFEFIKEILNELFSDVTYEESVGLYNNKYRAVFFSK